MRAMESNHRVLKLFQRALGEFPLRLRETPYSRQIARSKTRKSARAFPSISGSTAARAYTSQPFRAPR
jgi:hypothetical protein